MKDIRLGIVGIGNMGSAHLSSVKGGGVEGMQVTAVCDTNPERLSEAKKKFPSLEAYGDYDEMLEKAPIDGVLIAVPHPLHADFAIKALKLNLHTIVEKPVDISVSKALELNCVAKGSKGKFAIMFNQRTNELFSKARELVKNGELGEIKRSLWIITNWYRTQHYYDSGSWRATWKGEGGGVLLNQAPHNLDLWQWICGMPKSVTAFCNVAKYHNIEVEDEATIYTKYENGATGVFITSTGDFPGSNRLEISGTKGKVVIENGVLSHWRLKADEREVCKVSKENFCTIDYDYFEYKSTKESAHLGVLQNFTNAVLKGEELISDGLEGINQLTLSNAAYLSEWLGNREIELPFEATEFDRFLQLKVNNSKFKKKGSSAFSNAYNERWKVRW